MSSASAISKAPPMLLFVVAQLVACTVVDPMPTILVAMLSTGWEVVRQTCVLLFERLTLTTLGEPLPAAAAIALAAWAAIMACVVVGIAFIAKASAAKSVALCSLARAPTIRL
ncbi:MAG: hypothetical protein KF904_03845 [Rhodoblastus sp.]|nr:hypothetical protein [Rhodoblastus sp.]